jgi:hypothetical protein
MDSGDIGNTLVAQGAVAWKTLGVFLGAVIAASIAIYLILRWQYGSRLENKDGEIKLLERQLADYKEKLSGATPLEAQERMAELERAVTALQPRQRALTDDQKIAIANCIRGVSIEPLEISLIYVQSSIESANYAHDFAEAFYRGGWDVGPDFMMGAQRIRQSGLVLSVPPEAETREATAALERGLVAAGIEFTREVSRQTDLRLYVDMI